MLLSQTGRLAGTTIIVIFYLVLTKENKLPFSNSVCSKQTEVCHFRFPFAVNKGKLPFPLVRFPIAVGVSMEVDFWNFRENHNFFGISFYYRGISETWRHGVMESWSPGVLETRRHGYTDTWIHGHRETQTHRHI